MGWSMEGQVTFERARRAEGRRRQVKGASKRDQAGGREECRRSSCFTIGIEHTMQRLASWLCSCASRAPFFAQPAVAVEVAVASHESSQHPRPGASCTTRGGVWAGGRWSCVTWCRRLMNGNGKERRLTMVVLFNVSSTTTGISTLSGFPHQPTRWYGPLPAPAEWDPPFTTADSYHDRCGT